jgi:hypothetical protein
LLTIPLAPVPRLILSTASIPSITCPQTVYCLSKKPASAKQMKNWLSAESELAARAIENRTAPMVLIIKFGFQFLPKKTNFDLIYQHQIDIIQNKINNRPMKVLNWNTPRCVFFSS